MNTTKKLFFRRSTCNPDIHFILGYVPFSKEKKNTLWGIIKNIHFDITNL